VISEYGPIERACIYHPPYAPVSAYRSPQRLQADRNGHRFRRRRGYVFTQAGDSCFLCIFPQSDE
jgi:hypothetical protein